MERPSRLYSRISSTSKMIFSVALPIYVAYAWLEDRQVLQPVQVAMLQESRSGI